jgi:hypothetical protein
MVAKPEPAPQRHTMELCEYIHLINIHAFEFRFQNVDAPTVMPYRNGAGWMLVNRWSNGAEFIEDYATDAELLTALDARLARVQREARALRTEVGR